MSDDERENPVGSVAEEAAKLLGALEDWARTSGGDYTGAAKDVAAGAAAAMGAINGHIATGGSECRYCPVCVTISAVRQATPEVRQHLTTAAVSLAQAFSAVVSNSGSSHERRRPSGSPVEHIDLEGDG